MTQVQWVSSRTAPVLSGKIAPRRQAPIRRGGRAVDCTGLENRRPLTGLASSNLALSANWKNWAPILGPQFFRPELRCVDELTGVRQNRISLSPDRPVERLASPQLHRIQ